MSHVPWGWLQNGGVVEITPFGFEPHLAWGSSVTFIPAGLRVAKAPSWARPPLRVKEKEREREREIKKERKGFGPWGG
jgi:hypothetical protein